MYRIFRKYSHGLYPDFFLVVVRFIVAGRCRGGGFSSHIICYSRAAGVSAASSAPLVPTAMYTRALLGIIVPVSIAAYIPVWFLLRFTNTKLPFWWGTVYRQCGLFSEKIG